LKLQARIVFLLSSGALVALGIALAIIHDREERACRASYADLINLDPGRAITDAHEALNRNDLRIITVNGYGTEAPGIKGYWPALTETVGERNLVGTSDVTRCAEQGRFDGRARKYANIFNTELLNYFKLHGDKKIGLAIARMALSEPDR
jgi:hypothetical protein